MGKVVTGRRGSLTSIRNPDFGTEKFDKNRKIFTNNRSKTI